MSLQHQGASQEGTKILQVKFLRHFCKPSQTAKYRDFLLRTSMCSASFQIYLMHSSEGSNIDTECCKIILVGFAKLLVRTLDTFNLTVPTYVIGLQVSPCVMLCCGKLCLDSMITTGTHLDPIVLFYMEVWLYKRDKKPQ